MGLGVEVEIWYFQRQATRDTADIAAVAAATAGGTTYTQEARGAAAVRNMAHGQSSVTADAVA